MKQLIDFIEFEGGSYRFAYKGVKEIIEQFVANEPKWYTVIFDGEYRVDINSRYVIQVQYKYE